MLLLMNYRSVVFDSGTTWMRLLPLTMHIFFRGTFTQVYVLRELPNNHLVFPVFTLRKRFVYCRLSAGLPALRWCRPDYEENVFAIVNDHIVQLQ
jgi:hypothetical protein